MANLPDKKRNTFMSYVATPPSSSSADANSDEWCLGELRDVYLCKPHMLPHELYVTSAPAYMWPATTKICEANAKESIFGLLTVTNFKLAFVPHHKHHQRAAELAAHQQNLLLDKYDVTLNNIDHIYQLLDTKSSSKKKRIEQQHKVSSRIVALHIVCRNFRLLKYTFRQTTPDVTDDGKKIAEALTRFTHTTRHDLSFAYGYKEPYYNTLKSGVSMFQSKNDWARELIRCGASEWQVLSSESVPQLQQQRVPRKYTLPPHCVIPKCCSIEQFIDQSRAFCDSRSAFWVYSFGPAALLRMAELHPAVPDTKIENITLELVRKSHAARSSPIILQLSERLPSVQDVQSAYLKLRRLCTPEGPSQFLLQDAKFGALLEKSSWLFYVSLCLRLSCEAALHLREGITCVLQEATARDMCCLVSSLTQIILDPHFRTIDGFQSLVQKEWIALEHQFRTRLGHVSNAADDAAESPLFLLFLDCVWQLLQQFPAEFEYSETYLTTVWDACFLPIFDTFQFDSAAERQHAVREQQLVLRPVWDWSEQFAEQDKVFFTNPCYQRSVNAPHKTTAERRRSVAMSLPPGAVMLPGLASNFNATLFAPPSTIPLDRYLLPSHTMCDLRIWQQCYYRWLPLLEIKYGGLPQIDMYQRLLLANIAKLQRALELHDFDDLPDVYYALSGEQRSALVSTNVRRHSIDGVERRIKSTANGVDYGGGNGGGGGYGGALPAISSFFPFSMNLSESQQLCDILTHSNELIMEGSIMERLSFRHNSE